MKLLISQKNELFDLIEKTDYFTPLQFELIETSSKKGDIFTEVTFKDTTYYFKYFLDKEYYRSFFVNYSPGDDTIVGISSNLSWYSGLTVFSDWLSYLKRELIIPNKWERLTSDNIDIRFSSSFNEFKFSYVEYEELKLKINQIKGSLGTINLLEEQQVAISQKLDHLIDVAKDLNKFDWKNLFIGTIISIIIQLEVNKENAALLWELIKRVFRNFLLY